MKLAVIRFIFSLIFAIPLGVSISAFGAVSVTARLDRTVVMEGETANLSIVIQGGTPQNAEPFPQHSELSIEYRGHSQTTSIINGQRSQQHMLNYSVSASQAGKFAIPSIKVVVDGGTYATQPVTLTVTKADPSIQNRYAFLRLNVARTNIYVGELIPIELQLYVVDAENLQPPQLKSDAFIIHKQLEHTRSQAQIGNVLYSVLTFKMSVSAAKAGTLALGPAEMKLVLRLRAQPDPNDPFGFFGRYQRRPVTVTSPRLEMNVLPLPSPVPPTFTGAIGTFDWTVSASPTNLNLGDPITLKLAITGRGNLDNLKLPDFHLPGFRAYQPSGSLALSEPLGTEGSKAFEQVIVPQDAAIRQIPSLSFTYFDPAKKAYTELVHGPTPLKVTALPGTGTAGLNAASTAADDTPSEREDIVQIKSRAGAFAKLEPPLIQQPWFLTLQAIPIAGLIGFTLWRRRQDQLARNPRLQRKTEVQRTIRQGIAGLRHLASTNETEQFHALMFRLMQEQIGERLDLPAYAITEAVLDDRLPRRGATPDLIRRLHQLFQVSNQARYAPSTTSQELFSLSSELEVALSELQQLPD